MLKKICFVFLLFILFPVLLYAQSGKLRGFVKDQETGDPLPGANVIIVGTTYGAASDINGEYIILNVPVGVHSIKTSYLGYRDVTTTNIRVNIDLTTHINFDLPAEAIIGEEVVITAERPLVNTNATNNVSILTSEEIINLPIREYRQMASLAVGVVADDEGTLYVRGGREEETAYYVDGVYQNNLRMGTGTGELSTNSLEEVAVQAGGFNAEYGFANSAVVHATTKSGGSKYKLFGEIVTDEWLSKTKENLGTYSYGYNVYNLSLSGPVPGFKNRVKFFSSIERDYFYDRSPSIGVHPVLIEDRQAPESGLVGPDGIDIIEGKMGPLPNNDSGRWLANANIIIDLKPIRIKIGGNMTREKYDDSIDTYGVSNMVFNSHRNPRWENFSQSIYFKVTHALSSRTLYSGQINYFEDGNERYDPVLKRDFINYGDKIDFNNDGVFNPNLRSNGLNYTSDASTANIFFPSGYLMNDYLLNRTNYIGSKFDLTHQQGRMHEFKFGFEFRRHTVKRYRIYNPMDLATIFSNSPDIDPELAYASVGLDAYGYELVQDPGKNGDLKEGSATKYDKAKHPIIYAVYLQDKIEVSDLVLNLGLRVDHFDANAYVYENPLDIRQTQDEKFDLTQLRRSKSHTTISPRIGLAFPVTDKTVFYGQFGKFSQLPQLLNLFNGWGIPMTGGLVITNRNADVKPPKTTSFEVGFRQQIGEYAALDISAYYKQTYDMLQVLFLANASPFAYHRYTNGDYGTIKGMSVNFRLRRTARISANLSYTLQFAGGTGSTAGSNVRGSDWEKTYVAPTNFDQRHTGSLNVDVRFKENDGPAFLGFKPFANVGMNFLFKFGSGFPYTPREVGDTYFLFAGLAKAAINSSYGPWNLQLDGRIDRVLNVGGVDFKIYLLAINILGTRNWNSRQIYRATGDIEDNGFLASPDGKTWIADNGGEKAADLYRLAINSPDHWSVPRQLRLGIQFNITP